LASPQSFTEATVHSTLSTSYQQDDQDDQEYGAKAATDIWTTVVETTAPKQDQKNNDENYQVHGVFPPGRDELKKAIIR
jgi:hypothetical protein